MKKIFETRKDRKAIIIYDRGGCKKYKCEHYPYSPISRKDGMWTYHECCRMCKVYKPFDFFDTDPEQEFYSGVDGTFDTIGTGRKEMSKKEKPAVPVKLSEPVEVITESMTNINKSILSATADGDEEAY